MKLKVSMIILSLLILLSTSSFLWFNSLIIAVENGHASYSQLNNISRFGLTPRLYTRLKTLEPANSKWQSIAKILAKYDGDVAFDLGRYYLKNQRTQQAKLWFTQAIRLKHQMARISLAQIYIVEKKFNKVKVILLPIKNEGRALQLLIDVAISEGDKALIDEYAAQLNTLQKATKTGINFYQKLLHYQIIKNDNLSKLPSCLVKIQPYATNLQNLARFEQLLSSEKLSSLRPYICFSSVKYISKKRLACQHSNNEAIRCDESIWPRILSSAVEYDKGIRYIAVLVEKGGANVNSGILYLDSGDSDDVFFHEIVHLLGFVDEYPLANNHLRCQSVQEHAFSHNIAVLPRFYKGTEKEVRAEILAQLSWRKYIKLSTPLMTKTADGWLLGTDAAVQGNVRVGAYLSETCAKQNFVAIKPLKQRTALRYFEEVFPALYLQLLKDKPHLFLMPSYHDNYLTKFDDFRQKK